MQIVIQRFTPPLPSSPSSSSAFVSPQLVMDVFLYFDFLQALPHRIAFPRDMEKNLLHTPTYTWTNTHTHHITFWLPDLPVGPQQPNQTSAGRTAMTMQNGWTQRKGRVQGGMKTSLSELVVSPQLHLKTQRERRWPFCEPTEEKKSQREDA